MHLILPLARTKKPAEGRADETALFNFGITRSNRLRRVAPVGRYFATDNEAHRYYLILAGRLSCALVLFRLLSQTCVDVGEHVGNVFPATMCLKNYARGL